MGGSEIIVILVVALIFLGPDKLPGAAKSISKGIRDIKKQSRALQTQIENDEQIGGAIRDLKSALRGDEPAPRPIKPRIKPSEAAIAATAGPALTVGVPTDENSLLSSAAPPPSESAPVLEVSERSILDAKVADTSLVPKVEPVEPPRVKLPPLAGEPGEVEDPGGDDDLASLIKPAAGSVAKGT